MNPMGHGTVLHCTVLYCAVLYCTVLYRTVLHCTTLYCTTPHCTALHCTALACQTHCQGTYMWELMILVLCLNDSFSASEEDTEGPRFMCILLEAALASLISLGTPRERSEKRGGDEYRTEMSTGERSEECRIK